MKALCITGSDEKLLAEIAAPFYQVGMQPPKGVWRERKIDFSYWHDSVSESLTNKRPIGRMWEDIACDLILANYESDFWGWHESKSVDALEFWAALEPDIYFLLVCTKPEYELSQFISETNSETEAQTWLEDWYYRHQRMLEFYLEHPERCMLVDGDDACRHLARQLTVVKEHWRLPFGTSSEAIDKKVAMLGESYQEKPLAGDESRHIATLIVQELTKTSKKDIDSLRMELQAAQYPFATESNAGEDGKALTSGIETPQLQGLLSDYKRLCGLASERLSLKLAQEQALDAKALLERDKEREAQARSLAEEKAATAQKAWEETHQLLTDAKQENELLLLQLHQVQEELEHCFGAKISLERDKEEEAQARRLAEEKAVTAQKALEETGNSLKEVRQENEHFLLQLRQAQEELEQYFDAKTSLERDQDEEAQARSLAEEKAATAQKALEETSNSLKEVEQENELLLLQLHQVQEELEHYFLQYQEQVQENKQLSTQIERLKKSAGGSFANSVQVETVKKGLVAELQWLLTGITLDGEEFEQLALTTFIKFGQLGIRIDPEKTGTFIHYRPAAIEGGDSLIMHANNLSQLSNLSNSDYRRVIQLPQLLKNSLGQTNLSGREKFRWLKALDRFSQALLKLPPRLSYESVKLVHEQVNPDYEHLWLKLKAPVFGNRSASEWSFRISCANVSPGDFGRQPKLELPEQFEQLMHKWYSESQDENGKKLELRFALPSSMDFGVWKQIAAEDQLLLSALLRQMPSIINELRTQNRKISRSWDDWQQMVADMWRILNERLKR